MGKFKIGDIIYKLFWNPNGNKGIVEPYMYISDKFLINKQCKIGTFSDISKFVTLNELQREEERISMKNKLSKENDYILLNVSNINENTDEFMELMNYIKDNNQHEKFMTTAYVYNEKSIRIRPMTDNTLNKYINDGIPLDEFNGLEVTIITSKLYYINNEFCFYNEKLTKINELCNLMISDSVDAIYEFTDNVIKLKLREMYMENIEIDNVISYIRDKERIEKF